MLPTLKKLLVLLAIAVGLTAATGCSPAVELRSAMVRGPTPGGLQFDAVMAVSNPNPFDVQIENIDGNVRVDGVRGFVPVHVQPHVWCRAHRTTIVQVPVVVPYVMIPQILASSVSQPKVKYNVVGRARVIATSTYRWQQVYEFDEDGEVPRNMFLSFGMGSPFGIGVKK